MPDLKIKLERLLAGAAECEMIGSLAADADKRAHYRHRAGELRALAERVRAQVTERPRNEIDFLLDQAIRCRELAAIVVDDGLKSDLLSLAAELEQTAHRARPAS